MTRSMLTRTVAPAVVALALFAAGCGGAGTSLPGEEQPAEATPTTEAVTETSAPAEAGATTAAEGTTPETQTAAEEPSADTGALVDRGEVRDCLAEAGLAPEDTGLFVLGSQGTDVEALGVRMDSTGRVLLFVFDEDAASWTDSVSEGFAADAAEVGAVGNVVVAYEAEPSEDERGLIEGCLGAAPAAGAESPGGEPAAAGATISGVVTSFGEPVANVLVVLGEDEQTTTTDAAGGYVLEDVPPGEYLLGVADAEGFCLMSLTMVTVEPGEQLAVDLEVQGC